MIIVIKRGLNESIETCSINENEKNQQETISTSVQIDSTPTSSAHTDLSKSLNIY